MGVYDISPKVTALADRVEEELQPTYKRFDKTAEACTKKVMAAFEEFPLIIRETVEMETPASFAISFNIIEIPPRTGNFHLCV